jgi:hypothetical protein
MDFENISKSLVLMAAGGALVYYFTVMKPKKEGEIVNPDDIDNEQTYRLIENSLRQREQQELSRRYLPSSSGM